MISLLSLLPTELIVIALILAILGSMVGLVNRRVVGGIFLLLVLLPLIGPVVQAISGLLPWWLIALVFVLSVMSLTRGLLGLMIGDRATDHAVGHVTGHAIIGTFRVLGRILTFPFR